VTVTLSPSEIATINRLREQWESSGPTDELNLRYYVGRQRVEQLGMAIPSSMRKFLVVTNWPRVVVDTLRSRQRLRSLNLAGEESPDANLARIRQASNLDAHLSMFLTDTKVYGRGFLSCGSNEANPKSPLIRAESPRQVAAEVDVRTEMMTAAARFYGTDEATGQHPTNVTLYLPDATVWVGWDRTSNKWGEIDRDNHRLGRVPMVMHLNRRMSGTWAGNSEMTDIIPLSDAAARSLTNMQFAQEAHGIPRMYMTGVAQGDFVDASGNPIPKFEAYFNAIHTLTKENSKVGQLDAADLKNFETAMNTYGSQASIVTGFPSRYFGHFTSNPPNEASMKADEAQLVSRVEDDNGQVGVTLGWLGELAYRFMSGSWLEANSVTADWFDASTPTVAQREDALSKRRAAGVLSREGYWDELGWSETRKAKERAYFDMETSADPILNAARALQDGGTDAAAGGQ
jgi:hypothetical protein